MNYNIMESIAAIFFMSQIGLQNCIHIEVNIYITMHNTRIYVPVKLHVATQ